MKESNKVCCYLQAAKVRMILCSKEEVLKWLENSLLILCNNDPETFPCQNLKYGNSVIRISPKAATRPPSPLLSPNSPQPLPGGPGCKPQANTPGVSTLLLCSKNKFSPAYTDPGSPWKNLLAWLQWWIPSLIRHLKTLPFCCLFPPSTPLSVQPSLPHDSFRWPQETHGQHPLLCS